MQTAAPVGRGQGSGEEVLVGVRHGHDNPVKGACQTKYVLLKKNIDIAASQFSVVPPLENDIAVCT